MKKGLGHEESSLAWEGIFLSLRVWMAQKSCSFLLYTTGQIPYRVYVYRSLFLLESHLWLESGGNKLEKGIRECGAGAGLHGLWGIFSFLDFSRTG